MARGGMEWAIEAAIRGLGLDPAEVQGTVAKIMQIVATCDNRLAIIEAQNRAIMKHLRIENDTGTAGQLIQFPREDAGHEADTVSGT